VIENRFRTQQLYLLRCSLLLLCQWQIMCFLLSCVKCFVVVINTVSLVIHTSHITRLLSTLLFYSVTVLLCHSFQTLIISAQCFFDYNFAT